MVRSKNYNKRRLLLFTVFLFGIVVPFIPSLAIIEAFFLIIPFAIIFILTLVYLLLNFFIGNTNTNKVLFIFSILPTFIVSQIFAVFVVDKVQRFRSEEIIQKVHQIKNSQGAAP
ncbi:hypothetical protein AHMF7616_02847 [Adhaeribacter pallidiroseus]|uniref:Uncharacterized protein n=1 Tax=Adhaeribacter pallidiroseus TaxID=2072847 RepID=A0A369QKR2_9BACT|nr:hypothetical protein AHMF7616_02847 [Adhaeribacter pallidiroseus]